MNTDFSNEDGVCFTFYTLGRYNSLRLANCLIQRQTNKKLSEQSVCESAALTKWLKYCHSRGILRSPAKSLYARIYAYKILTLLSLKFLFCETWKIDGD